MNQTLAFEQLRVRNELAMRSIRAGATRGEVMHRHNLSATAYAQLVGHVRSGVAT